MLRLFEEINYQNILPKDGEAVFFACFFNKTDSDRYYKSLLEVVNWRQDKIRIYGKWVNQPRLTAWFGDKDKVYEYSGIEMKPDPWLPELLEIKNAVDKIAGVEFTNVLLNLYRDGHDSVGWHADNESALGKNPVIASVSFGAARIFKFRHMEDKTLQRQISLTHGSILLMKGQTQHNWQHQVPKTLRKISSRINLTFRVIYINK